MGLIVMGNLSCVAKEQPGSAIDSTKPIVYMTKEISSKGLVSVYEALGKKPKAGQKVAVKISTGESSKSNHLRPDLIKKLVQLAGGDLVECNTAYGGNRNSTAEHYAAIEERGYNEIAKVVIMDEAKTIDLPIKNAKHLSVNRVGSRFADYQFHMVLSHFKGHQMAGYGGAIKNMSIGYASSAGKSYIHTAGKSWAGFGAPQNDFLESMAESAKSIVDFAGKDNFIYINVMNRLSVDCDCNANPAEPTMADIGILASTDPVALDKACMDLIDASHDGTHLRNRISQQNGKLTMMRSAEIGLGNLEYVLVKID